MTLQHDVWEEEGEDSKENLISYGLGCLVEWRGKLLKDNVNNG